MESKVMLTRYTLRREDVTVTGLDPVIRYTTREEMANLIMAITKDEVQEVALALFFDARYHLLGYLELARGGTDFCQWDQKLLFSTAILCGAKTVIMGHNHPSGYARPSRTDVVSMKKLIPAGDLLTVRVEDHIVVGKGTWVSMQEFGLLPNTSDLVKEADKKREEAYDLAAEGK